MSRDNGSCLFPLMAAMVIVVLACGTLALGAFAYWQLTAEASRRTILILGLDRRPEQGYTVRSDVMILMSVYPAGPRVALLSIPRDLYVDVPRHGAGRINTAHFFGEREAEGGGPALAMETVAQNFGVPVHRYVRIDFDGFRAIVDAVGGVDVVVEEPIVDNAYPTEDYGTMRIEIPAGLQHLDGETALQYVRSRHGSSDFDRAERQQQVIIALVRRLSAPGNWHRLPAVYRIVSDNVSTDLSLADMVQLAPTLYRVGAEGIEHEVIDRDLTRPWTTPTGGAVLLPRWEAINPLVEELFAP